MNTIPFLQPCIIIHIIIIIIIIIISVTNCTVTNDWWCDTLAKNAAERNKCGLQLPRGHAYYNEAKVYSAQILLLFNSVADLYAIHRMKTEH